MVPQAEIPKFIRTQTELSPIDLHQKFKAIDAKALVSIQALPALNIFLWGNRIVSKNALTEFLHDLTFQALSKQNDKVYLNFDNVGILVLDILECLAKKDQQSINVAKILNENIVWVRITGWITNTRRFRNVFKKRKKTPAPLLRYNSMLLLNEKEINKIYNDTKEDYLKTAITINKTDLDAAIENADGKNEKIISDLINPMPGLFVDDQLNLED